MNFNESLQPDARFKDNDNIHVRIRPCLTPNQIQVFLKPDQKPSWTGYIHTCLESGTFCDVFFQCEDALIGAHRIVISSASKYLKTLFQESYQDQVTIILPGVSGQIMHLYLRLLYGERIIVNSQALYSLIREFGNIAASLGISDIRLSRRETKGYTVKNFDLKQKLPDSTKRCASCDSLSTNAPNIENITCQKNQTLNQERKRREKEILESMKMVRVNWQVSTSAKYGFSTSTPKTSKTTKNKTLKLKKNKKLKCVLKKTVLSEQQRKQVLGNMKKTAVEVSVKQNENFNNDALKEVQRLKEVLSTSKCLVPRTLPSKKLVNPNYARPREWRPKVVFNCKTWNLPPTLLICGADKKKGFTCAICQRRLFGQEKANFHVYKNHYFQLCSLAGDAIPEEIKPDFSQPMWGVEYLEKEKKTIPSQKDQPKENQLSATSLEHKTEEAETSQQIQASAFCNY